jgi:CubicO group peptidase (beta-lactamase class C family)
VLDDYAWRVRTGEYGPVDSLIVVRHGAVVLEEYFRGWTAGRLHPMYSVTKSVTSLLFGIAIDLGLGPDLEQPLLDLFPEYPVVANMSPRKRAILVRHVLAMRAGLQWDESTYPYTDPRNSVSRMSSSADWVKYVLDLPMADEPGARFLYNSGCSVLLGAIVGKRWGSTAADFARKALFEPLEIATFTWETGHPGISNTGWGLHLRPLDLARIGQLVLQRGLWRGRRLVSEHWLAISTAAYSTGDRISYGYQWWRMPLSAPPGAPPSPDDIVFGWGWGGQFVFVVPTLDAVVVSTASQYDGGSDGAYDFVREMLLAATVQ